MILKFDESDFHVKDITLYHRLMTVNWRYYKQNNITQLYIQFLHVYDLGLQRTFSFDDVKYHRMSVKRYIDVYTKNYCR